jgi:hypothetical protein
MMRQQVRKASLEELLFAYKEAARTHGAATESGDHKAGNKAAALLSTIYAELRHRGEAAQRRLLLLLRDDDPGVRLWSASHALDFAPSEGKPVLQALIPVGRFLGLSAKTTLAEWEKGRLQFP